MTRAVNPHLAPLSFLLRKTWKGEFSSSTPDKPMVDVMRWEPALNGNAIRVVHSVNDGEYGGETMILWDPARSKIIYFYFTTSGFYTRGTLDAGEGHYTTHEEVTGNTNGITAVKSHTHTTPNGKVSVESQYFRNGTWVEGHSVIYSEAPAAEVVFQ
jgi:hypothetical protein